MTEATEQQTGRNLVICYDGTGNEPGRSDTNVIRVLRTLDESKGFPSFYDPGIGTLSESESTGVGNWWNRTMGLAFGQGLISNVGEGYTYLMNEWQPGDRVYLFGFSRGAYTARALAGMLNTLGLLRPGNEALVPYAIRMYGNSDDYGPADWAIRRDFARTFGRPDFPAWVDLEDKDDREPPIRFAGLWDTVKFVRRFGIRPAHWPYTRKLPNVRTVRHAVSLDERRRQYHEYLVNPPEGADFREIWFSGVHSDVGGTFATDPRLADISLRWMAEEAKAAGLHVVNAKLDAITTPDPELGLKGPAYCGEVHRMSRMWWLVGLGWRNRRVPDGALLHRSVEQKSEPGNECGAPYTPRARMEGEVTYVDR